MDTHKIKQQLLRPLKKRTKSIFKRLRRAPAVTTVLFEDTPLEGFRTPSELRGGSVNKLWRSILEKAAVFAILSKDITEVHPSAQKACTALALVNDPKHDEEQHTSMSSLLIAMDDLYGLVINRHRGDVGLYKYRKALLKSMSLKTAECADYIHLELEFTRFWNRAGSNPGSRIDIRIRELQENFVGLIEDLREAMALETEAQQIILTMASRVDSRRTCVDGTRVRILDALRDWADNPSPDTPPVFFLLGGAGTGKSAIAHSIGVHFAIRHRIGSFISFNLSPQQHPATSVIRTVAHDFAHWIPDFRGALADVLRHKRDLERSNDVSEQWEGLIVEPLGMISLAEPMLLVIDAFDACGPPDAEERRVLLKHLTEKSRTLPQNLRILITSRPQHDVLLASESDHRYFTHLNLDSEVSNRSDVERYVRWQLSLHTDKALSEDDVQMLIDDANGLFQRAVMACRAVSRSPDGFLLNDLRDHVYQETLEDLFTSDYLINIFRSVMALLLCASSPLSIDALDDLYRLATGAGEREVTYVVQRMGFLLSGIHTRKNPVYPLYPSLRDFLTNADLSGKWFIDVASGHRMMALACLRVMNKRLSFNICGLETSGVLNRDISDLEKRVSECIAQSLSYAACNWEVHLPDGALPSALQQELDRFVQEKLLFWFELLSLLKALDRAAPSLEAALKVYQGELSNELLPDAIAFIRHFANVAALASSHVYISALPFSPDSSAVRRAYLPQFPFLPIVRGIDQHWPQARAVLPQHTGWVIAVAWFSDGRRILSGNEDGSVDVWDVTTGHSIRAHSKAHSKKITCVKFSPNGSRFVTASRDATLRVWDSAALQPLGEPLHGHTDSVVDVDFSPDGCRILSCSEDGTLRIWNAETQKCLLGPFSGHGWLKCVAWAPNGTRIASSAGRIVRLWDPETGSAVGKPFTGHDDWVQSVSWSGDSQHLITSSHDGTVRFWDVRTGAQEADPLQCHQGRVNCARTTPEGRRVVSAGEDGTMRMWDIQAREPVGIPLSYPMGSNPCHALVFSPDGRRILSHMGDLFIVWNVDAFTESPRVHPSCQVETGEKGSAITKYKYISKGAWDGWIRDANDSGLVMWVPDEYRESVCWHGMVMVLGRKALTVDFTHACYGPEWRQCYGRASLA